MPTCIHMHMHDDQPLSTIGRVTKMRTVEFLFDDDTMVEAVEIIDDCLPDTKAPNEASEKLWAAIGKLSMWAASSERYAQCRMTMRANKAELSVEIIARYSPKGTEPDKNPAFDLAAIWRPNERIFTFHS